MARNEQKFDRRGAEAKVYFAEFLGRNVVIKEREPKAYRIRELDISLRQSRTKAEARTMIAAARQGARVPQLLHAGTTTLIMERLSGKLLKDMGRGAKPATYKEIGKTLAAIHSAGVAHGDFTPANILIDKGKPAVIDFGLAVFSSDAEEQAIDLLLMKRSIGKSFDLFLQGYVKYPKWKPVLDRMAKVEQRGRYHVRGKGAMAEAEDETE